MAVSASSIFAVQTAGADTNSGAFDPGATMATDLAATVATGNSPVVTSVSYVFVAGDVGASVFLKGGTNWTKGWYPIASVAGGAATLNAAISAADLYGGTTAQNTVAAILGQSLERDSR